MAAGDVNHDGALDIFITSAGSNLIGNTHQLLINNGDGTFVDTAVTSGIPLTEFGWSAALVDFDNDGHLDLAFAGSGILPANFNKGRLVFGDGTGTFEEAPTCGPADCTPCSPFGVIPGVFPGSQPNLCFTAGEGCDFRNMNTGLWGAPFEFCNAWSFCDGCYRESQCAMLTVQEQACVPGLGVDLSSSRSTTVSNGDFDGDGYDDIAIMAADYSFDYQIAFGGEPLLAPGAITNVVLLKNGAQSGNNFIKLKLVGRTGNRGGIGSHLTVDDGSIVQFQEVRAVTSPLASFQQWPSFGLGQSESASVVVTWYPSGAQDKFCVNANTNVELVEGDGRSTNAACGNVNEQTSTVGTGAFSGNGNGNNNGNGNGQNN
jgi:hypothetical protein